MKALIVAEVFSLAFLFPCGSRHACAQMTCTRCFAGRHRMPE